MAFKNTCNLQLGKPRQTPAGLRGYSLRCYPG